MLSTKDYELSIYTPWNSDSIISFPDNGWRKDIEEVPKEILEKLQNEAKQGITIFPYPNLVFKAFELKKSDVNIVIIGQDPYFNSEVSNGKIVPQAMGMSFSVPIGIKIPPSLNNIYKNLVKYGHLKQMPKHGNLERIASQGVLFLNSALTVQQGNPNSHKNLWVKFTDKIITSLDRCDIVFVLWGGEALKKSSLISNGTIIGSSHPSPMGADNPCGSYKSFNETDFAKNLGIDWNILLA